MLCLGLLDAPQDLRIEALGENTVILRWSPPFTLDVTDVDPDIFEYRVYILNSNTSNQEMKSIAPNVTEYQFVMNDECGVYEFSVSALNEVGEGKMSDPVVSICSGGKHSILAFNSCRDIVGNVVTLITLMHSCRSIHTMHIFC